MNAAPAPRSSRLLLLALVILAFGFAGLLWMTIELRQIAALAAAEPEYAHLRFITTARRVLVLTAVLVAGLGLALLRRAWILWRTRLSVSGDGGPPYPRATAVLAASLGALAVVGALWLPSRLLDQLTDYLASVRERNAPIDWRLRSE